MIARLFVNPVRRDMMYGGRNKIVGTTDELGVRGSYLVRLYHQASGQLVQQTVSDKNGDFQFDWIRGDTFFCVAHGDNHDPVNSALRDYLTSEDRGILPTSIALHLGTAPKVYYGSTPITDIFRAAQ